MGRCGEVSQLIIDLREILHEQGLGATFRHTIANPYEALGDDLPPGFHRPIQVQATVQNTGSSVLANVSLETQVSMPCSRCLAPVAMPIRVKYTEEYVPAEKEGPLPDEAGVPAGVYRDKQLDLSPGIRENLLLALPLKPLCRPDCAGLCPQCGQNLNEASCRCTPETPIDPRLAQLQRLLEGEGDS